MRLSSFKLTDPAEAQPFVQVPEPEEFNVPLSGHKALVKKGDRVRQGDRLAEHSNAAKGDAHSPVCGLVTAVTATAVSVKKDEAGQDGQSTQAELIALADLKGPELAAALKKLGFDLEDCGLCACGKAADGLHLVINGLNPEPGILWADGLLSGYAQALNAGVDLLRRLLQPSKVSLVLPEGSDRKLDGDLNVIKVKAVYPNSLDDLVIKAATGKERPEGVCAVSLHTLWRCGMAALSGLPSLHTVMTVQDKNYIVPVGVSLRSLLELAGITAQEGDFVILGGQLRGSAVSNPDQPVAARHFGLFHVLQGKFARAKENPCINCGLCVQYCPSHIMVNIISRHAEFQRYDECKGYSALSCMDCGLCGYYCIARRPLLQYMREATRMIKLNDAEITKA
ncbi:MAG: NADH:quinone oxidoreductase subunit RnfC [Deltaproteobacteria bacterium]|jgi:electron transport complex protein RnfC|nr:NADH:quinone oxidoreductase subunit RnfC [Deltaproteobacteria bacterium]